MPNPLRLIGRALTGSTYAKLGFDAARTPGARVDQAAPMLAAVRRAVPLPADDETIVRTNGAVQAAGGALLALGVLPRTSALAIIASLVPTTVAGHGFWNIEDPILRKQQEVQFHKNLAMLGGLVYVLLDRRDDNRSTR